MKASDSLRRRFVATLLAGAALAPLALFRPRRAQAANEVGRRRVPVSLLPALATTLAVSIEALLGQKDASPGKRGPTPKLQQQMERIQHLPRSQQRFVMQVIDTVLAQQGR